MPVALQAIARASASVALGGLCIPLWPVLAVVSALTHPMIPSQQLVPRVVQRCSSGLLRLVLAAMATSKALAFVAPAQFRTILLWRRFMPIYLAYMWTDTCNKIRGPEAQQQAWESRHEWGGIRVYAMVLELSGYCVKLSQVLATKTEFMPQQWTQRLQQLFDSMPPQPWPGVKASIESHLATCPLATASELSATGTLLRAAPLPTGAPSSAIATTANGGRVSSVGSSSSSQANCNGGRAPQLTFESGQAGESGAVAVALLLACSGPLSSSTGAGGDSAASATNGCLSHLSEPSTPRAGPLLPARRPGKPHRARSAAAATATATALSKSSSGGHQAAANGSSSDSSRSSSRGGSRPASAAAAGGASCERDAARPERPSAAATTGAENGGAAAADVSMHSPSTAGAGRSNGITTSPAGCASASNGTCALPARNGAAHIVNGAGTGAGAAHSVSGSSTGASTTTEASTSTSTSADIGNRSSDVVSSRPNGDAGTCSGPGVGLTESAGSLVRSLPAAAQAQGNGPAQQVDDSQQGAGGETTSKGKKEWLNEERAAGSRVLSQDLPRWMQRYFEWVEAEALAAASIAQVHRGKLSQHVLEQVEPFWRDHSEVVLKVQHKKMQRLMTVDLANAGRLASFIRGVLPFDPVPVVMELQAAVPREFDFDREGRLTTGIRERLEEAGLAPSEVIVPHVLHALSTPQLLVLQQMEGIPFTAVLSQVAAGDTRLLPAAQAAVRKLVLAHGHLILRQGVFHGDPHPGNLLLQAGEARCVLLDFGQCKALTVDQQLQLCRLVVALEAGQPLPIALAMMALGLSFGPPKTPSKGNPGPASKAPTPASCPPPATSQEPAQVQASGTGVGSGGLEGAEVWGAGIDGMPEGRAQAGLTVGLAGAGDSALNLDAVAAVAYVMFDTRSMDEARLSPFKDNPVLKQAPITALPPFIWMFLRSVMLLRGLCHALHMDIRSADIWAPLAAATLAAPESAHAAAQRRAQFL